MLVCIAIKCGKENKMYKFTYQVLDFNTVDDQFVVLVKTTDSKVEKQEEIIHIDYAEDQITEADFKELLHRTVQTQLWPKWRKQNIPTQAPPAGTDSFIGKSFDSEYDYGLNKVWQEPVLSIDDPWEELISEADIE
tara:strand:- start:8662 stop:9069 length:408 start_codon:yes stop_codon:yes gene_type:complete